MIHGNDGWEESEEAWELGEEEMIIVGTVQQEEDCSWQDALQVLDGAGRGSSSWNLSSGDMPRRSRDGSKNGEGGGQAVFSESVREGPRV